MTVRCDCGGGSKDGRWNRQPAWRCVFATLPGRSCTAEVVTKVVREQLRWKPAGFLHTFSELVRSWCPQQEVGTRLCYSHDSAPRREASLTSTYCLLQSSDTSCSRFALLLGYFLAAELRTSLLLPGQLPAWASGATG